MQRWGNLRSFWLLALVGCSASSGSSGASVNGDAGDATPPHEAGGVDMPTAHLLVTDQFNNRVLEIDRQGTIHWSFGDGSAAPGPTSVVGPNDAERLPDGTTLISGSGAPQMADPACKTPGGCADNRVILVDASGKITWQYGASPGADAGSESLSTPVCARMLAGGNVLITDQGNNRIIEVTRAKAIVWQYPVDADAGQYLNSPNSAERLASGNTLIADESNNRVIEVDHAGNLVWQYPTPDGGTNPSTLGYVAYASRLASGNTLVTASIIQEVTPQGAVVWSFDTAKRAGSVMAPNPSRALRLSNGNTLISDQFNEQVIEVDGYGDVVFTYGKIGMSGSTGGLVNAPYDAKVIGDFTGMTPPGP